MGITQADRAAALRRARADRLALSGEVEPQLAAELSRVRSTVAGRAARASAEVISHADLLALAAIVRQAWQRSVAGGAALASDVLDVDLDSSGDAPWLHVFEQAAEERIVGINAATMRRVGSYVSIALREGWSPARLARLIRRDPSHAFSPARARTIARTETGYAYNLGSLAGFRRSGQVERVVVHDGNDCTWPHGHGGPPVANGMVVGIDLAQESPLAHPNCVRAFSPIVEVRQ